MLGSLAKKLGEKIGCFFWKGSIKDLKTLKLGYATYECNPKVEPVKIND